MIPSTLSLQLLVVLAVATVLYLVSARPSAAHVGVAVALYMFPHSFLAPVSEGLLVAARPMALLVLLVAAARSSVKADFGGRAELLGVSACAAAAYFYALVAHGLSSELVADGFSLAVVAFALVYSGARIPGLMIRRGVEAAILVAVLVSLSLGIVYPAEGIRGGRLEGVFLNANTLGFFCAIGIVLAITGTERRMRWGLLGVCSVALVATGSRSPMLAVALAMFLATLRVVVKGESQSRRVLGLTGGGVLVGYVALQLVNTSSLSVLREARSREAGTEYARWILETKPWAGVGYEMSTVEVASSPLRWLAEVGLVGFGAVALAYSVILVLSWRRRWQAFLIAVFGVVSSLFEGWYFAGGSGLFLTYWLAYFCAAERPSPNPDPGASGNATTEPGVRWAGRPRAGLPRRLSVHS